MSVDCIHIEVVIALVVDWQEVSLCQSVSEYLIMGLRCDLTFGDKQRPF